jgi:hypothetical protein
MQASGAANRTRSTCKGAGFNRVWSGARRSADGTPSVVIHGNKMESARLSPGDCYFASVPHDLIYLALGLYCVLELWVTRLL